jgi:hypothetical protein
MILKNVNMSVQTRPRNVLKRTKIAFIHLLRSTHALTTLNARRTGFALRRQIKRRKAMKRDIVNEKKAGFSGFVCSASIA